MHRYIAILFVVFAGFCSISTSAQTSCLKYPSNSTPSSNYAASWDVFSSGKELLVKTNCPTSGNTLTLTVGRGDSNQLVYKDYYTYQGSWTKGTFSGASSNWVTAQATASITAPVSASVSSPFYFVGYVCTREGSAWKCGCKNASCSTSHWQLQGYTGAGGGGDDDDDDDDATGGGDTFSCLSGGGGSLVTLSQNFGYTQYSNRTAADGTKFDARGATWLHQQTPSAKNLYPVQLGGAANGCFAGGIFEGTTPLSDDWRERYGHTGSAGGNSAAIRIEKAPGFTVSGVRLHNMWDSVRATDQSTNFTVRDNWITDGHDDCVENDTLLSGRIRDNLFDGCFVFASSRPGSNATVNSSSGAGNVVKVENNLVYMKAIRRDNSWQEGHLFKINPSAGGPKFEIHDNLFMHEGKKPPETADADVPEITSVVASKVKSCSGNVMIWLGEGPFPGTWPNGQFPGCLRVVTGEDGRSLWNAAKQNWVNCHPGIKRLSGDPTPNSAACKPNAWGGGGTQDPR